MQWGGLADGQGQGGAAGTIQVVGVCLPLADAIYQGHALLRALTMAGAAACKRDDLASYPADAMKCHPAGVLRPWRCNSAMACTLSRTFACSLFAMPTGWVWGERQKIAVRRGRYGYFGVANVRTVMR